ncbi:MAG: DUF2723 domain-containing protein, partial [Elusimicrobia bacterium]|nr:DUF2723 domain-containing protein [Elusimicrobiota bacterium]
PSAPSRTDLKLAALTAAALGLLYWLGRCPSFGGADSPQHVLSAVTWGVSWPPGYPLYVMLGHLASLLPGSAAGNVSALSGLLHALAAALFFLTLRRLSIAPLAALCATALLALSPLYWYYSELGEVRALNDLLALAAAYGAVAWTQSRRPAALAALAAVLGLGISHHPTFVFILPAVAYWLWRQGALSGRRQSAYAGAVLLSCAALPYLILGVRLHLGAPAYNLTNAAGLLDMPGLFLRKDLGGPLRVVAGRGLLGPDGFDFARFWQHLGWFLSSAYGALGPLGLALLALGLAASWRKRAAELAFWGLWLGVAGLTYILLGSQQLRLANPEFAYAIAARFHLLPLIAVFPVVALGAGWLAERWGRRLGWTLLAAALVVGAVRHPVSLRRSGFVMDYAREMVRCSGTSDMIIMDSDASTFAMLYLDLVERATGDRVVLVPSLFGYPPYRRWLAKRHPGLNMPAEDLLGDWTKWTRLNAGRALYAEAESWNDMRSVFPASAPWGVLIRAWEQPPSAEAQYAGLQRLLDWPGISHRSLYPFSPEAELVNTYRLMLRWGLESLPEPKDRALSEALLKRFSES